MTFSQEILRLYVPDELKNMREEALRAGIPVADDETLQYLLYTVKALQPKKILEIGTAVGLSGSAMLLAQTGAVLTTIEADETSYVQAKENFSRFSLGDRVTAHLGDAGEILPAMPRESEGLYDLIFLDGPKAQYVKYLPDLKRLLRVGGVLFADDVLFYGWVNGDAPKKRHAIVDKIKEYLREISADRQFVTSVLPIGNGVAVSVLIGKENDTKGREAKEK